MNKSSIKKAFSLSLVFVLCICLCACGESAKEETKPFKMTTAYAADQTVPYALEQWVNSKLLSLECSDFDYSITSTERSDIKFANDKETGMMWYNACGVAKFYNEYGDLLMTADFIVVFGHDGEKSFSCVESRTVVTPRY